MFKQISLNLTNIYQWLISIVIDYIFVLIIYQSNKLPNLIWWSGLTFGYFNYRISKALSGIDPSNCILNHIVILGLQLQLFSREGGKKLKLKEKQRITWLRSKACNLKVHLTLSMSNDSNPGGTRILNGSSWGNASIMIFLHFFSHCSKSWPSYITKRSLSNLIAGVASRFKISVYN